jgi:hypothetical protein
VGQEVVLDVELAVVVVVVLASIRIVVLVLSVLEVVVLLQSSEAAVETWKLVVLESMVAVCGEL